MFSLRAFGSVSPEQGGPRYTNYQLIQSGKHGSQVIVEIPEVDPDAKPTLLWAGDIDRDVSLDAMFKLPSSYASNDYTLYEKPA